MPFGHRVDSPLLRLRPRPHERLDVRLDVEPPPAGPSRIPGSLARGTRAPARPIPGGVPRVVGAAVALGSVEKPLDHAEEKELHPAMMPSARARVLAGVRHPRARGAQEHRRVVDARACVGSLALGMLVFFAFGCPRAIRLPEIDPKPPTAYSNFGDYDGLRIAVDPYVTKERVAEVFGVNLLEQDIVPVLFVFENQTRAVFSIERTRMSLVNVADLGTQKVLSISPDAGRREGSLMTTARVAVATVGVAAIVSPAAGALLVVGGIAIEHADANRARIRNHMLTSELGDRTLSPEQSMRGFVFFRVPVNGSFFDQRSLAVHVQAQNLSGCELTPRRRCWVALASVVVAMGAVSCVRGSRPS